MSDVAFAEEFAGRAPKVVYAVKLQSKGHDGRRRTYVFLYASKASYDQALARFPQLINDEDVVTTLLGTVEWLETGQLTPVKKEVKVKPPKKPKPRAA